MRMFLDEHNMAAQVNDIYHNEARDDITAARPPENYDASTKHEARTFGLPRSVWGIMLTCCAMFFSALAVATGHDRGAIFVVVISCLFALMFFCTGFVLNSIDAARRKSRNNYTMSN